MAVIAPRHQVVEQAGGMDTRMPRCGGRVSAWRKLGKSNTLPWIELLVESEEAFEVALLGLDGRLRLAGDLGEEVDARQRRQAHLGAFHQRSDVMLRIIGGNEGVFWHGNPPSAVIIYTITVIMV